MSYSRPVTGFEALVGYSPDAPVPKVDAPSGTYKASVDVADLPSRIDRRPAVLSREAMRLLENR